MPTLSLYFHKKFLDENWQDITYQLKAPTDLEGHGATGEWVMGRRPTCDLTIAVKDISKRHASILYSYAADRWAIQDIGSSEGTFLRGQRLLPGQLHPLGIGDRFWLASNPINVVEDEQDTVPKDDGPPTVASTEPIDHRPAPAPAPAPPPAPPILIPQPKTYADTAYLALQWCITPTTALGVAVRLVLVAVATVVLVLWLD